MVEAILAVEVTQIRQVEEYGPELSELGEGIDMVSFEAKLDLLHASPLMGRRLPLFIPVRRRDGTKRRSASCRRLFLAWGGLSCQHEGPGVRTAVFLVCG